MITIIKNDHTGREILHYEGVVLDRGATWVKLEAPFNWPDKAAPYHTFRKGDRFIEFYYSDRWYNIFEMHDVDTDQIVGWYCNVTRPALLGEDTIHADDLALDLFVSPEGVITVLDEDEFAALPLDVQYSRAGARRVGRTQAVSEHAAAVWRTIKANFTAESAKNAKESKRKRKKNKFHRGERRERGEKQEIVFYSVCAM